MIIVPFIPPDQEATAVFMRQIYLEMKWSKHPLIGIEDLANFFHLPDGGVLFLIKFDNRIVGTGGWIKLTDTDALLKRFFIAQEVRGSGIAEELFNKLVSTAKEHNVARLLIDVSKNNERAIHFFEKNGFKQFDQKPVEGWDETKLPDIFNYYTRDV